MIKFFGPSNNLGYGVHLYETMKALHEINHKLSLFPTFGQVQRNDNLTKEWLNNRQNATKEDTGIMIFHEQFLFEFSGQPRIGFPVFETDKFDKLGLAALESCDLLLTTSQWGKQILEENAGISPDRIGIVNEGYDPKKFFVRDTYLMREEDLQRCIGFIHVGKWEARKSSKEILTAYLRATNEVKRETNFAFHVLNPFVDMNKVIQEIHELIGKEKQTIAVRDGRKEGRDGIAWYGKNWQVIVKTQPYENIVEQCYQGEHFGIFASKAEGWNLPLIEAIACGLPCITTNVTAQSEYINENYPEQLVLKNVKKVVANDGVWFHGDRGHWYDVDTEEITAKVKAILDNPEEYLRLSEQCINAVKPFTWARAAKQLEHILTIQTNFVRI